MMMSVPKVRFLTGVLLSLGLSFGPGPGRSQVAIETPSRQACEVPGVPTSLSELIAASDYVVVATPQVDGPQLLAAAQLESPGYIGVRLAAVRPLKGEPPEGDLTLRIFPKDRPYAPSNAALIAASNAPSIFFLTQVDQGPLGLYFAGGSPNALQSAGQGGVETIAREIARQRRILENWRPDRSLPHDRDVARLIEELVSLGTTDHRAREQRLAAQQDVFRRIETLGAPAVPAIISHMDDRRRLAFSQMSLVNHNPDAFEGMRHYGPDLVVDALHAILNQITGKSFGNIYNAGSERERRAAVNGWRIYAANLRCPRSS